jgi:hypothetical protein
LENASLYTAAPYHDDANDGVIVASVVTREEEVARQFCMFGK